MQPRSGALAPEHANPIRLEPPCSRRSTEIYEMTNFTDTPTPDQEPNPGADLNLFGESPLWTPEIEQLGARVAHWIRCDLPGAAVRGVQRIGKSFCAEYLRRAVPDILGGTAVAFTWAIELAKAKGELETIRDWLSQSGSNAINHNRIGILKARLYDHLISNANAVGAKRIVLIIDEAHRLEREHFQILMILFNGLQQRGKKVFVLLVGEPKLQEMRKSYNNAESLQIIGRFFSVEYQFCGIDPERLHELLDAIDEERQIANRYLPKRVAKGFKLAHLAPFYINALETLCKELGLSGEARLPMQHLRSSLNSIVYELRDDARNLQIDEALVLRGLRANGFSDVMQYFM